MKGVSVTGRTAEPGLFSGGAPRVARLRQRPEVAWLVVGGVAVDVVDVFGRLAAAGRWAAGPVALAQRLPVELFTSSPLPRLTAVRLLAVPVPSVVVGLPSLFTLGAPSSGGESVASGTPSWGTGRHRDYPSVVRVRRRWRRRSHARHCRRPLSGRMYVFSESKGCPRLQWVCRDFLANSAEPRVQFSRWVTGSRWFGFTQRRWVQSSLAVQVRSEL